MNNNWKRKLETKRLRKTLLLLRLFVFILSLKKCDEKQKEHFVQGIYYSFVSNNMNIFHYVHYNVTGKNIKWIWFDATKNWMKFAAVDVQCRYFICMCIWNVASARKFWIRIDCKYFRYNIRKCNC